MIQRCFQTAGGQGDTSVGSSPSLTSQPPASSTVKWGPGVGTGWGPQRKNRLEHPSHTPALLCFIKDRGNQGKMLKVFFFYYWGCELKSLVKIWLDNGLVLNSESALKSYDSFTNDINHRSLNKKFTVACPQPLRGPNSPEKPQLVFYSNTYFSRSPISLRPGLTD